MRSRSVVNCQMYLESKRYTNPNRPIWFHQNMAATKHTWRDGIRLDSVVVVDHDWSRRKHGVGCAVDDVCRAIASLLKRACWRNGK